MTTFFGFRCNGGKLPPSGIFPPSILLLSLLQQHKVPGHFLHPPRAEQRTEFTFPFSILFEAKVTAREQKATTIHCVAHCIKNSVRAVPTGQIEEQRSITEASYATQTVYSVQIMSPKKVHS